MIVGDVQFTAFTWKTQFAKTKISARVRQIEDVGMGTHTEKRDGKKDRERMREKTASSRESKRNRSNKKKKMYKK